MVFRLLFSDLLSTISCFTLLTCLDQWSKIKEIYRTFRLICRSSGVQMDNIFSSLFIRKLSPSYHSHYRFRHEINALQSRKSTVIELCNSLKKPRRDHKQRYKKKNLASALLNFVERTLIRTEASKRAWTFRKKHGEFLRQILDSRLSSLDTWPIFYSALILRWTFFTLLIFQSCTFLKSANIIKIKSLFAKW